MAQYILFDLDGTLTDPKEGITRCVQYALEKLGIHAEQSSLLPFIGPPLPDSFHEFFGLDEAQTQRAVQYYRERFGTVGLYENEPYPAIPPVLTELKRRGCTLAVATSKPTVYSVQICDRFGLRGYFDTIVGSELDGTRTDKAEVIAEVLRQLGARPDESCMVGDRRFDIEGAHKCGLRAIGVRYGYAIGDELERAGADAIADTPHALLTLL